MIVRDLYRCPPDDLLGAMAACEQTVVRWGVVQPASALSEADVAYLVAHPDFDPALSFVAFDGGDPVAFLASRIEGETAVWGLLGGSDEHGLEMVLADALDRWRDEGATRARQGPIGLLGSAPRLAEDAEVIGVLRAKDFDLGAPAVEMAIELKRLPSSSPADQREEELRRKGYFVRDAQPDEVAVVARQYHPRHTGLLSQEEWNVLARHLRPDALVVCEHRRQIIGFTAFLGWTLESDAPVLGPVFVEQVHRDTGLDAVFLRHALRMAREAGKAGVRVLCDAGQTGFYEAGGMAAGARFCRHATLELD